ncbi:MAG: hypothetical protein ACK6DF_16315 [Betaproteobacteria bacterium]
MDDLFPANEVEERPCSIELRGREVPFVLKRSQRRRRIAFLVNERGLAVHAPWRASESVIDGAIRDAARWILAKLDDWQERPRARLRAWNTSPNGWEWRGRGCCCPTRAPAGAAATPAARCG